MIHQTCFLLSLSLGLYEDGSFLHRLETQLPPKPPAPFLCLKFPIGLPSSNTLRIRLKFLHFFPIFPTRKNKHSMNTWVFSSVYLCVQNSAWHVVGIPYTRVGQFSGEGRVYSNPHVAQRS